MIKTHVITTSEAKLTTTCKDKQHILRIAVQVTKGRLNTRFK